MSSKHLTIESWIFHETLIEAILMASLYRMDIACPNLSSKSWNIVPVSSTDHANTAPLKGEQKFVDLVGLLSEIQIRYKSQVSTLPRPTTYLFNAIVCTRQVAHTLNYEALIPRANLVVRLARFFYICLVGRRTFYICACADFT